MSRRPPQWEKETLYLSGDLYFAGLLQSIAKARHSIELETYIYEGGTLGDRMTDHLVAAAQRGVHVRLIIDGWGSPDFAHRYWPKLKSAGVRMRFFRVLPWSWRRLPGDPKKFWSRLMSRFSKANRGNHRKFCLVDHSELWVGSFNISDVHLQEISGPRAWKDAGVCVSGIELRYAHRAFRRAYRGWTALNWPARSPRLLLLNDSFLHKRQARLQQISRLKSARKRIWLATPYFIPVGSVFRLLAKQAQAGVDVRLLVPGESDVWLIKWMSLPLLENLSRLGVKIFVDSRRFSHQKLIIADDWISLGSTNLNHRSFLHDLEMDVVLTHPENKEVVVNGYREDQSQSQIFDSGEWLRLPFWKRGLSLIFLLARYWS